MTADGRRVQGLLWDLDGVIVDSAYAHYESWRDVLAHLGIPLPYEDFERFFGMRNEEFLAAYVPDLPPEKTEQLIRQKEALYQQCLGAPKAMPGAAALADRASKAGLRQAIVSSTLKSNVESVISTFALQQHFETIIGAEQVRRGKPDPEGWLLAAQALACPPHRCVVIEDAAPGIQAAHAAGMRAVGLAPSSRRDNVLSEADLIVRSLNDPRIYAFLGLNGTPSTATSERRD